MKKLLRTTSVLFLSLLLCAYFLLPGKIIAPIHSRHEKRQRPEGKEALEFLSEMESYPNADIPKDAFAHAFSFYKRNYSDKIKSFTSANNWHNIGPYNISGRTLAIVVDPVDTNMLWAGAAGGGLWKSTTGGIGKNAWTFIPTGYSVLGVSCIAINPANHTEMYIGTGEVYQHANANGGWIERTTRGSYGIGILKSTDGGNTWAPSLDWTLLQNRGVWKIVFNPENPHTIYAATTEGIYKTMDDGSTWNPVLNQQMVMDLTIDPSDSSTLYAGVGDQGDSTLAGVYETNNAGSTWSHVLAPANNGRTSICIAPQTPSTVYALCGQVLGTQGFYMSADKGKTWTSMIQDFTEICASQGWYAKLLLANRNNSSEVIAGGVYLFQSVNEGQNWTFISNPDNQFFPHVDYHDIAVNPKDPEKIYTVSDGGLFRSNDFGASFYSCNDGMITTQFYSGDIAAADTSVILGGLQDNSCAEYKGTGNWTFFDDFGDGEYAVIDKSNPEHQIGQADYGYTLYTYDQGKTWTPSFYDTLNFPNSLPSFVDPLVKCVSDPNVLYSCAGGIYRSTDFGKSFYLLTGYTSAHPPIALGVSSLSPDTFYVGSGPVDYFGNPIGMIFYRTYDGGTSFTDVTNGLPDRYPRDIAVDPANGKIVYAVFSGFGTGHVFKTKNGGDSWTDISGSLPDLPVNSVLIDPSNPSNIYIGTDFNIYASLDTGRTWMDYSAGLPEVTQVYRLITSDYDHSIVAFTHGHGVFKGSYITYAPGNQLVNFSLSCFPNPANSFIQIQLNSAFPLSGTLSIYSVNGVLVKQLQLNSVSAFHLLTSSLTSGMYYCAWAENGKIVAAQKFIVSH